MNKTTILLMLLLMIVLVGTFYFIKTQSVTPTSDLMPVINFTK